MAPACFRPVRPLASAAMDTAALAELDRTHLWHPFTQQRGWESEAPVMVERAQGCTLYDTDGNAYIDGVSSLWCTVHGHRHPAIDAAVREQLERVAPDLMCIAKGVTGGSLPLAATLTTERVYAAFLGEHHEHKTFFHGHTYTGNPLACAAALATLDVFEAERTLERLEPKIALLADLLDEHVAPLPAVAEVRRRGFMTGIELGGVSAEGRLGDPGELGGRPR